LNVKEYGVRWNSRIASVWLLLTLVCANAHANVTCTGLISYLGIDNAGYLYVNNGFGIWQVCSLSQAYTANGLNVAQDACKGWYASMLAAQKSGAQVALYFYNSNSANPINGAECNAFGNWSMPSPYFIQGY